MLNEDGFVDSMAIKFADNSAFYSHDFDSILSYRKLSVVLFLSANRNSVKNINCINLDCHIYENIDIVNQLID